MAYRKVLFEDLDELYSKEEVTIFDIKDYFRERYIDSVEIYWDCQDWGFLKRIFCKKKTGCELYTDEKTGNLVVMFYDKARKTVEMVEEAVINNEKYKLYQLLIGFKVDGLIRINRNKGKVLLDMFDRELPEDSLTYKLRQMCNGKYNKWKLEGIDAITITLPEEDFKTILDLMR